MPLVRIDMPKGKSASYRQAISAGVHQALIKIFSVPPDDLFQIMTEHGSEGLIHTPSYLGNTYSQDFIIVQITVNDTRTLDQKKALYKQIVENLAANPGLRPDDVMINLLEVKKENWSFGRGEAPYA